MDAGVTILADCAFFVASHSACLRVGRIDTGIICTTQLGRVTAIDFAYSIIASLNIFICRFAFIAAYAAMI